METVKRYQVEITLQAKLYYFEILAYFYEHLSRESATKKAEELYDITNSLETLLERGQLESMLQHLNKEHRYLLYRFTSRSTIKVIYFLDKKRDVVYVIGFFPTEMDLKKINYRNQ